MSLDERFFPTRAEALAHVDEWFASFTTPRYTDIYERTGEACAWSTCADGKDEEAIVVRWEPKIIPVRKSKKRS